MSLRSKELGINLSLEACGPATKPFFSGIQIKACAQGTAFCPTASAPDIQEPVNIDFEPLRAQMRQILH
jgi:hypothetical protein